MLDDRRTRAMLALFRDKGLITAQEYEDGLAGRVPARTEPPAPPVRSRFDATLYGFVELDGIYDSTQSFNELAGNALVARPGTFSAAHGRTLFTVRNSRLGFRLQAPEVHGFRATAVVELDLLGNQPATASEAQMFVNDTLRIRHAYVELRAPFLTLLLGQTWQLFGWQPYFHPATVAIQGVPGEIYARAPQIRLAHTVHTAPLEIDLAAAVARAPQRDAAIPDVQAGARLTLGSLRGPYSAGSTGTSVEPASIGLSGVLRTFRLAAPGALPDLDTRSTFGWGVSLDARVPLVPAKVRGAWALTASGSLVCGAGIADLYTGLTGGVAFPNAPLLDKAYGPLDVDAGLSLISRDLQLKTVAWRSLLVGAQLYLPPGGALWLAANFSQMDSDNTTEFLAASAENPSVNTNNVVTRARWADVNLFWDIRPGVLRIGAEYAWFWQRYDDAVEATNHRVQLSAFYLF